MQRCHGNTCVFFHYVGINSIGDLNTKFGNLDLEPRCIRNAFVLIIANKEFQADLDNLPFVDKDMEILADFSRKAGFTNVQTKSNLISDKMLALFTQDMRKQNFEENDAFICFISSHGNADGVLGIDGNAITIKQIVDPIIKLPTLASKPKLFFINSCRGNYIDRGQNVLLENSKKLPTVPKTLSDGGPSLTVVIPSYADTMISYSSWEGYVSYGIPGEGSQFITILASVLIRSGNTKHLRDMLVMVNQLLAGMGQSEKQMPCFTCSLLKPVKFNISK